MKMSKRVALIGIVGMLFSVGVCAQEEAGASVADQAAKPLRQQVQGYWAIDMEAEVTGELMTRFAEMAAELSSGAAEKRAEAKAAVLEEMKAVLPLVSVEITEDAVRVNGPEGPQVSRYTVKSEDLGGGSLELEMTEGEDEEKLAGKMVIKGDRLDLTRTEDDETLTLALKRIDKERFSELQEELSKLDLDASGGGDEENEQVSPPVMQDGYPVARPVPDKPGFVFNPHNNHVVDVRGIPSGTLVRDPSGSNKLFRVP